MTVPPHDNTRNTPRFPYAQARVRIDVTLRYVMSRIQGDVALPSRRLKTT